MADNQFTLTNVGKLHSSLMMLSVFSFMGLVTAVQAEEYDWSGSYIGGSLGAAYSRASFDSTSAQDFPGSYFISPDAEQISTAADKTASDTRLTGGIFGGYGKQFDKVYLGLELGINSLNIDEKSASGETYISNPAADFTNDISVKADWQATLRSRIGWAEDNWLAYFTAGVAATRLRMNTTFSDDLGAGVFGRSSNNETEFGWLFGVGGEYALNDRWTLRGDYIYVDYGKVSTTASLSNPGFPGQGNDLKSSVDVRTQILSVGVSYRF